MGMTEGFGAIGEGIGALVGNMIAQGKLDEARQLAMKIYGNYMGLQLPEIMKMFPELQGDTALAGNKVDAKYGAVEDDVLNQLMKRANGGMTDEDKANLMQARVAADQQASGQSAMLDREARRRGAGGAANVSRAVAGQQASNRLYMGGVAAAGDASSRALDALKSGGSYASSLAGRGLNQQNLVGGARDRISEFNTNSKNQANLYNNEIPQRQFENNMAKINGGTEGLRLSIDQLNAQAQMDRQTARSVGKAGGTAVGMAASA